jgi:hypothetical protein
LEQIHEAGDLEKDKVKHPTTLHDLRALKLIMTNDLGRLELVSKSLMATPEMLGP